MIHEEDSSVVRDYPASDHITREMEAESNASPTSLSTSRPAKRYCLLAAGDFCGAAKEKEESEEGLLFPK